MQRRSFLKKSCAFCLTTSALGLTATQLTGCAATGAKLLKIEAVDKHIHINKHEFDSYHMRVIRSKNWEYDIAVFKKSETEYLAMSLRCTHADEPLMQAGDTFICNVHGSRFSSNGDVLQGPAQKTLEKLKTVIEDNHITIQLI